MLTLYIDWCEYIQENEFIHKSEIVSEYDQEIAQSQTADNPVAPQGRAAQPSQGTRKTNEAKQPALSYIYIAME